MPEVSKRSNPARDFSKYLAKNYYQQISHKTQMCTFSFQGGNGVAPSTLRLLNQDTGAVGSTSQSLQAFKNNLQENSQISKPEIWLRVGKLPFLPAEFLLLSRKE